MRTLLLVLLCSGCGSAANEAPTDAAASDTADDSGASSWDGTSIDDYVYESSPVDDTATPAEDGAVETSPRELVFVGTDPMRSSWICLHAFTSSDPAKMDPVDSVGPFGLLDDTGKPAAPLTFGTAVHITASAEIEAAVSSLHTVVSAHSTKPDSCKLAWSTVSSSTNDWVMSAPGMFPKGTNVAFTFGERVRSYRLEPRAVASPSYGAQLINEASYAASFALQRRDEGGSAIGAPVPLGGTIAAHAVGPATALTLPTTGSFASSDLVVDTTPLSLLAPSFARLQWSKDDGRGSLIVYVDRDSSPTIVLVPWH